MDAINRKTILILILVLSSAFVLSCKEDPIKKYGDEVIDAMDRSQGTVDLANMKSLQNAVRMYRMENNSYPDSLEEVVGFMNSPVDLNKYLYDPDTGKVTFNYDVVNP
jgi:hypothetical protein